MKINKDITNLFKNTSEDNSATLLKLLVNLGMSKSDIQKLIKMKASKNLDVYALAKDENFIDNIYKNDINKINHILNSKEILNKLNGAKILVYGETGTGKTTLINKIIKMNEKKFKYKKINFEAMLSHKFGQSQINIINLLHEINDESTKKPLIVFIDEMDSIISSREISNDIGEHARIIATFLKFIDGLDKNIILIGATNLIEKIDDSVKRRFNIRLKGEKIGIIDFINMIKESLNLSSVRRFVQIKNINADVKFKISDLNEFENAYMIERSINKNVDVFSTFIKIFKDKLVLKDALHSRRAKKSAEKAGIDE